MTTLQDLIDRYINGLDDEDEMTAVPKNATYAGRRAKGSAVAGGEEGLGIDDSTRADAGDAEGDETDTAASYPIFIPSKGRYDPSRHGTCALLARSRIPFCVVVEPQEASQYHLFLSRLEGYDPMLHAVSVIPASHQGVSYVRNYIAKHLAPEKGWFWQMDDDIRAFSQSFGDKKNTPITPRTFFREFAARMKKYPTAALFSAEYEMFAFSYGPGDVAINSYNNIAKLFKRECMPAVELPTDQGIATSSSSEGGLAVAGPSTPAPVGHTPGDVYRFKVREDYDIVLRMIKNGYCAVRFRDLSYRVPSMAECSGGMTDYYTKQRDDIREQNKLFISAWPMVSREVIKGAGKDLRFDVKVNWSALNPQRAGVDPQKVLSGLSPDGTTLIDADIDSLLISDAEATQASKLREREAAVAMATSAAKRGVKGEDNARVKLEHGEEGDGDNAAVATTKSSWRARRRGGAAASTTTNIGGEGGRRSRGGRRRAAATRSTRSQKRRKSGQCGKRRRADDSDDEDDVCSADGIVDDDADEVEVHTLASDESDETNFDSDDDDDDLSSSSSVTSTSSGEGMEGDDEEDEEDEEKYFAIMEEFYNPRKARARERAEAAAVAGGSPSSKGKAAAAKKSTPKPKPPPKPTEEKPPQGWAGYAMVMWRDVEPDAAEECGLRHLNSSKNPSDASLMTVGSTVAFIPVMFEVKPSVMVGTIISVHEDERNVQVAPGRKYRGVPLQTVAMNRLYDGACPDPFACAAVLDAMLDPPAEAVIEVTRSNVHQLIAKASHL